MYPCPNLSGSLLAKEALIDHTFTFREPFHDSIIAQSTTSKEFQHSSPDDEANGKAIETFIDPFYTNQFRRLQDHHHEGLFT